MLVAARYMQSIEQRGKCVNCLVSAGFWRAKGRPAGSLEVTVLVRSRLIVNASVCTNSGDNTMAQIAMASQVQRNSQRGVGTACQSGVGSHSQGCHWRKRLESCAEIERDKDTRERERKRRHGGWRRETNRGETRWERQKGQRGMGENGRAVGWRVRRICTGKKERERESG